MIVSLFVIIDSLQLHLIGSGAVKRVYKAVDRELGIERAWNEIAITERSNPEILIQEIELLGNLKSQYIIEFSEWWINPKSRTIVFITEFMSSGSLKQYLIFL